MNKLSIDEIKSIIKENYNIDNAYITKINRGNADIYLIETKNNKFVLKYYQSRYTVKEINNEFEVIDYLNKKGIKVPKYLLTKANKPSLIYKNQVLIMQYFIEGTIKEKNQGKNLELIESAKYLGKIIKALEDFNNNDSFDEAEWYKLNPEIAQNKIEELLNKLPDSDENAEIIKTDLNKKLDIINKMKDFDIKNIDKVSVKYTHGDYGVMQFIYDDNNKIKAILDFATATYMPIVWEIIRSYSHIDKECIDGNLNIDNLIKYINEFKKYVPLNKYDLEYMPYIYLNQLLKSTFGYKSYVLYNNLDLLKVGILRTKIVVYLYENLKEISNRLIEEC